MRLNELSPLGSGTGDVHGARVRNMAWITRASFRAVATRATGQPTRAFCAS